MIVQYEYPTIYRLLAQENHLLIAGAQGSGKSVCINGIIYYLLSQDVKLAFIDLKKVELAKYARMHNTLAFADTASQAIALLQRIEKAMHKEYKRMQRKRLVKSDRQPIYLIIDEYAELRIQAGKAAETIIQSISQLGRAANIHVILATQCPLSTILTTPIKVNLTAQIALHTRTKQDSRNILSIPGAESLNIGEGLYYSPKTLSYEKVLLPMISEQAIESIIKHF